MSTAPAECTPSVAADSPPEVSGGEHGPESLGPSDATQAALDGALAAALALEDDVLAAAQSSLDGCADDDAPEDEGVMALLSSVQDGSDDELPEGGPEEGVGDVLVGSSEDCLSASQGNDTLAVVSRLLTTGSASPLPGPPRRCSSASEASAAGVSL